MPAPEPQSFGPDDFAARSWRPGTLGVHLVRTDENTAAIAELSTLLGGPIGVAGLLGQLKWPLRRSWTGRLLGRAVRRAWRFDRYDQRDPRWWPQGMACAPADVGTGAAHGHEVVAVTWYSRELDGATHGSRVTFVDLTTRRYRHVLLVDPVHRDGRLVLQPLRVHAGGLAWAGNTLHVAATGRGFFSFDVRDVMRVDSSRLDPNGIGIDEDRRVSSYGHRYVLPVRAAWQARAEGGVEKLRYSFLSTDTTSNPPVLIAGEYGRADQTTRLVRFPLDASTGSPRTDPDGTAHPLEVDRRGERQMQGVVQAGGRHYLSVSRGPWRPGDVLVGRPGAFRRFERALPMGPEDLDHRASDDSLWTVTEHPWRRWIVQAPRRWFDR